MSQSLPPPTSKKHTTKLPDLSFSVSLHRTSGKERVLWSDVLSQSFSISQSKNVFWWCLLTSSFVPSRPVSLRSLTPFTFNKADEIGNDLLSHSNNPAIAGIYSGIFHLRREWMPLGQSLFVWTLSAYYSRGRDRSGAEAFEVWIFTSAKVGFGSVGCSARFFVG